MKVELEWISVNDRLPEDVSDVLFFHVNYGILYGYYYAGHKSWNSDGWEYHDKKCVTHWMKLPEPPNS